MHIVNAVVFQQSIFTVLCGVTFAKGVKGVSSYDGAASFVVGDSAINDLHDLSVVEIAVFDEIPTVCSDVKPRAFILCKLAVAPCEICRTS